MAMTDPIADMLTRVRNAVRARKDSVAVPSSKTKRKIAEILKEEGFIEDFTESEEGKGKKTLTLVLRYGANNQPAIMGIVRVSKPGLRVYVGVNEIPVVRSGLGVNILSTPKGVVTGETARAKRVGGELLCTVW